MLIVGYVPGVTLDESEGGDDPIALEENIVTGYVVPFVRLGITYELLVGVKYV